MKYYISIFFLLSPFLTFTSEKNINTIFEKRETLAKTFLNLAHTHTYNYTRARDHLFSLIKNDPHYIAHNNRCILEFPSALFCEVDNEDIYTNQTNLLFLNNLKEDRSCVQTLFEMYTQEDISPEYLTEKTSILINILTNHSKQYE